MLVGASASPGGAAGSPAPPTASVARALRSETRAGIYQALRESGEERTVRDIAAAFDVHPNVARTHLELLAEAGLVTVGRRKHPAGGRPAKVYRSDPSAPGPVASASASASPTVADPSLVVRLLAGLLGVSAPARPALLARAQEAAAAEGRRLVSGALRHRHPTDLQAAAEAAVEVLARFAPTARTLDARTRQGRPPDRGAHGSEIVVAGLRPLFAALVGIRPDLADAFERGLLGGALAAAGAEVALLPDSVEDGDPGWRLRPAGAASGVAAAPGRQAPEPAVTADTRGLAREAAVVAALRAATRLRPGQVLEVLTEGPGAPAAFARWADRAGHSLLGVERIEVGARPAIRLLVRKGR